MSETPSELSGYNFPSSGNFLFLATDCIILRDNVHFQYTVTSSYIPVLKDIIQSIQ